MYQSPWNVRRWVWLQTVERRIVAQGWVQENRLVAPVPGPASSAGTTSIIDGVQWEREAVPGPPEAPKDTIAAIVEEMLDLARGRQERRPSRVVLQRWATALENTMCAKEQR